MSHPDFERENATISHFCTLSWRKFCLQTSSTIVIWFWRESELEEGVHMSSAWMKPPAYKLLIDKPTQVFSKSDSSESMTSKNRVGDRMEPCFTPLSKTYGFDSPSPTQTLQSAFTWKLWINLQHFPLIPTSWSRNGYSTTLHQQHLSSQFWDALQHKHQGGDPSGE